MGGFAEAMVAFPQILQKEASSGFGAPQWMQNMTSPEEASKYTLPSIETTKGDGFVRCRMGSLTFRCRDTFWVTRKRSPD